ncbi:MAG: hypothetical protein KAX31_05790 [Thermoplasmata archaeon]|nr:hypothetical protein [Thermoplasmata archaeon]
MSAEISRKIQNIMAREMGQLGKFIVNKQCKNLGINPDDINEADLERLSKAFGQVMLTFGGKDKATKIKSEIRKLSLPQQ